MLEGFERGMKVVIDRVQKLISNGDCTIEKIEQLLREMR